MNSELLTDENGVTRLWVWCPGCDEPHCPVVEGAPGYDGPVWEWNGDLEKPTVSPSLLVSYQSRKHEEPQVCHSFVRDGQLQFLSDCTHALAGQTVPLPRFDVEATLAEDDLDGDW